MPDLMEDGEMPDLMEDGEMPADDSDSCDEEEYEEEMMAPQVAVCLFCEETFSSVESTFQHCKSNHQFDVLIVQKLFSLDVYGYIKLINFIRKTVSSSCHNIK